MDDLKKNIEAAWNDRQMLALPETRDAILRVIEMLDQGKLRVATRDGERWITHEWIKKAVILYFPVCKMEVIEVGPFQFHDKIPLKRNYPEHGVRVVPHAIARYGAYLASGVVLMPSYVNIGAFVTKPLSTPGYGGLVRTDRENVHLTAVSHRVLEPVQAAPVVIEDNCFLGSRSIVVEGIHIGREAVLGANVVITGSTRIFDVSGSHKVEYRGHVPSRSVVIPGTYPKKFPAGEYQVPCALIIGQRKASTDLKTSLNQALRDFDVAV